MTHFRLLVVAFVVGVLAAAGAWVLVHDENAPPVSQGIEQTRDLAVAASRATPEAVSTAAAISVAPEAETSVPVSDDVISDVERDEYAYQFATQPALIDALEDSVASDPAVREDAERLLNSIVEPDPSAALPLVQ